jgi:hypothetical protein
MQIVQSVIINKFYSLKESINIIHQLGFENKKVDETLNYYRFRQHNPNLLNKAGFNKVKTECINKYICLIIYYK